MVGKPVVTETETSKSYDYGDGKEIAFASISEAKKYITHLQKKPERVYVDA